MHFFFAAGAILGFYWLEKKAALLQAMLKSPKVLL